MVIKEKEWNTSIDFTKINLIKHIEELKDYRGYKRILVIQMGNGYLGYLDEEFFGFKVPDLDPKEKNDEKIQQHRNLWFMKPEQVVDYYFSNFHPIFHNSEIEYNQFYSNMVYRPYINALKYKLEKSK